MMTKKAVNCVNPEDNSTPVEDQSKKEDYH